MVEHTKAIERAEITLQKLIHIHANHGQLSDMDIELELLQIEVARRIEELFTDKKTRNRYWEASSLIPALNPYSLSHTTQSIQKWYEKKLEKSIRFLGQAISDSKEELEDRSPSKAGKALRAYKDLTLHPEIERAAGNLFENGHYANSIEDAVKALNALVRLRSGIDDKDGMSLMNHIFGGKDPVLRFNNLKDESDRDEQKGFQFLFAGAVAGLRNPRAHKLMEDDPERALEFIAFISLLAKLLDGTQRPDRG